MSLGHGIVNCNLCGREYFRYKEKDLKQIFGVDVVRNRAYSLVLSFVDIDKTSVNKHICTSCIANIVDKFGI